MSQRSCPRLRTLTLVRGIQALRDARAPPAAAIGIEGRLLVRPAGESREDGLQLPVVRLGLDPRLHALQPKGAARRGR